MTDRLGNIIIFCKIGAQQKKRSTIKRFGCQILGFHPNRMIMDIDLKFDSGILKKWILFFNPGHLQALILIPWPDHSNHISIGCR